MGMNKFDVLGHISHQMQRVLDKQNELAEDAFATDVGFEQMRANYIKERRFWNEGGPLMRKTYEIEIPAPNASPVPVRLYVPTDVTQGRNGAPCIIYIHGGGFVAGCPDTHDRITRILAQNTGAIVVSVDYPLSPEARFPKALNACVAVAEHLHRSGADYGIDGGDLSFAGDSGGAALSLATYLFLRDEIGDALYIRSLLLYYGMFGLLDSPTRRLYGGTWDGMDVTDLDYYMQCYCGDNLSEDIRSPYINCFNADLTQNMPPCYIAAAEYDPLRDDSSLLAEILQANGEPHRFTVFPGVLHAFLHHSRMLDAAGDALAAGSQFFVEERAGARVTRG